MSFSVLFIGLNWCNQRGQWNKREHYICWQEALHSINWSLFSPFSVSSKYDNWLEELLRYCFYKSRGDYVMNWDLIESQVSDVEQDSYPSFVLFLFLESLYSRSVSEWIAHADIYFYCMCLMFSPFLQPVFWVLMAEPYTTSHHITWLKSLMDFKVNPIKEETGER